MCIHPLRGGCSDVGDLQNVSWYAFCGLTFNLRLGFHICSAHFCFKQGKIYTGRLARPHHRGLTAKITIPYTPRTNSVLKPPATNKGFISRFIQVINSTSPVALPLLLARRSLRFFASASPFLLVPPHCLLLIPPISFFHLHLRVSILLLGSCN